MRGSCKQDVGIIQRLQCRVDIRPACAVSDARDGKGKYRGQVVQGLVYVREGNMDGGC
jgi:hypothetical protein